MNPPLALDALMLAGVLFLIGLVGVLARRNLVFMLVSVEVMFNAAGLAFVAAGAHWGQTDGQVMTLMILTVAAAEVAVGLALALLMQKQWKTLDTNAASRMRN